MATKKVFTVNFGSASGGLATVGYQLKDSSGASVGSRITSGVYELGTSTGIYGANVSVPDGFSGSIQWDTGGGSPKYANEDINFKDTADISGEVRTLLRAHLNQLVDFFDSRMRFNVDFKPVLDEFVKLKEEMKKTEATEEDDDEDEKFQEILKSIERVNQELRQKESNIIRAIKENRSKDYDEKFKLHSAHAQEISKKVAELEKQMNQKLDGVLEAIRFEASKIAPSVKIPNYEARFLDFKNQIASIISSIYRSNKEEISGTKEILDKGIASIKFLISELNGLFTAATMSNVNKSLKELSDMMVEMSPEKQMERKRKSEQHEKNMNLMMGTFK